jgi:hypothetical protein
MSFIETDITVIIPIMDELSPSSQPLWGSMSAQRMIEHLTDTVKIASGKEKFPLEIPEDRIERMQTFLESDKPMARNIEVPFAGEDVPLRNEEIELAIDEFLLEWIDFENFYDENPDAKEYLSKMLLAEPVNLPFESITRMCISSFAPPTLET